MAFRLLAQYFGDGVETEFALPGNLTSGYAPVVKVDGVTVAFTYADATPDTITLGSAPLDRQLIDIYETNEILATYKVQAIELKDIIDNAPSVAGAVDTRTKGAQASYLRDANGAQTALLAANDDGDRQVIVVVTVDTVFADGDGAQPTFVIGQTGTTNKFMPVTALDDAAAGVVKVFQGTLTDNVALLATAVAATGATSTGAITVAVIAVPKA